MQDENKDKFDVELPQSVIESFARFLVPEIRRYYAEQQEKQDCSENQKEDE